MKGYLLRLTAASILAALMRKLSPKGGSGKAVDLAAGLLVLLTALGPFGQADTLGAAQILQDMESFQTAEEDFSSRRQELMEELIREETEAYILDKAEELGMEIAVDVSLIEMDGTAIPWQVTLTGSFTSLQRLELAAMIQSKLNIPKERQEWLNM